MHEKMVAFVLVCPSRFFSLVEGRRLVRDRRRLRGTYDSQGVGRKGGMQSSPVTIAAGDTLEVAFKLDGTKYQREPHLDKNGKPYSARTPAEYE